MSEADAQRGAALDGWNRAAAGWGRQRDDFARQAAPVSNWMLDAAELSPGQRVLDLAGGPGELGIAAAPRVLPGGSVTCSDQSEKMVDLARAQGEALGLTNVEYRVIDAEWIDMELASVDVVLCRWGYMLMVDPAAAMRETRRVLRSEGRLVLAVWDDRNANPWSLIPNAVLVEHGLTQPPPPGEPGPFALGDRAVVQEMLEEAGFTEVEIDTVELARDAPDFDSWWAIHLDLSASTLAAFQAAGERQTEAIEDDLRERLRPYTAPDGSISVPGRTFVARAQA
ncbi:MAG TPA: class I SAM-dependent methyltransferase [Solirubrobacteraceae bacterium]|nr:class I SAM-dependent methyltransferase [Solirubrobacteraceae bacterium]